MAASRDSGSDPRSDERPSKRVKTDNTVIEAKAQADNSSGDATTHVEETDRKSISKPTVDPDASTPHDQGNNKPENKQLKLVEETGDIFDAPNNTLVAHACNCEGSWGGGIAKAFKIHYPTAFEEYKSHCDDHGHDLMGTAQLIPPLEDSSESRHFVGALYTSRKYGRGKDKPAKILDATGTAVLDLFEQVTKWNEEHDDAEQVAEIRICRINSGLFAVPWEKTVAMLEQLDVSSFALKTVRVVERESK